MSEKSNLAQALDEFLKSKEKRDQSQEKFGKGQGK